ncbi:MAG: His-Xaa-Ser system radical SAM maturase HxsC [Nostoc sp. DedSLP03]|uniref:His-Xaa-Ser system radical SAM maturase HxsC n=1 Tax=Nostoc sp. DedSLP03 TaxID=3075400 RepID=UPI002AD4D076|nr:His-Xaa-Ser system radical SAM maturase HxsC [Nostoc sp. DedSLP03]MDZ7968907.1 His-Xaa-Ser system radical SAM maturase HxsC [Nostoc sp. DedSLP03]
MLKLHGFTTTKWNEEPFIARLTDNHLFSSHLGESEAFIVKSETLNNSKLQEFRCLISKDNEEIQIPKNEDYNHRLVRLPTDFNYLVSGDIIKFYPQSGRITVFYRKHSKHNVIFLTERCNSNCLMCSQPPRNVDDSHLINDYLKVIPLMSTDTVEIGITGGEPTLLKNNFLNIVKACRDYLPSTSLHTLSNGRLFSYLQYAKVLAQIKHPDLMIGIPLYSDIASIHDYVVQAKGAFNQTIKGIINLARTNVQVEIRIVVHKQTYERLPQIARFIARNLPFASHITFMGLEIMGHTRANLDNLWIDPVDYQDELEEAVHYLHKQRMNVSIYNHQLCVLRNSLWSFAKNSISDWKNEYFPQCESCVVKNRCGGFFSSATLRFSNYIYPISSDVL